MGQIGITYLGQTLLARQLAGEVFTFTNMKIGTGIIPNGTELANLTDLITPLKSVSIYEVTRETDDETLLKAYYDNKDFTTPKTITEFGIYAKIGEEAEQLYAYIDSSDAPENFPAYSTATFKNIIKKVIMKVGNANSVQAIINQDEVFATVEMLTNEVSVLNTEINKKIDKNLFTALNDFILGSGAGTVVKKTLEEIKNLLGINKMFGVDQTWENVTSNRTLSTTYVNTTQKSILVSVQTGIVGSGVTARIYCDDVIVAETNYGSSGMYGSGAGACAVIPSGSTYKVVGNSLIFWEEMR